MERKAGSAWFSARGLLGSIYPFFTLSSHDVGRACAVRFASAFPAENQLREGKWFVQARVLSLEVTPGRAEAASPGFLSNFWVPPGAT